jgi:hypothetical protein
MNSANRTLPLSKVYTPPPARLAARTEQRCLSALHLHDIRRQRRAAVPLPRWEWLVYATSLALCGTFAVQMTWAQLSAPPAYATLGRSQ